MTILEQSSAPRAPSSSDLELHPITSRVLWSLPSSATDRPVLGAIVGDRATLVVDAGNSPAHARAFRGALVRHGGAPVRYLAFTHWHWDHVFGASEFRDAIGIAHATTKARIEEMSSFTWDDASLDDRVHSGVEEAFCRDMIKAELPSRDGLEIVVPQIAYEGKIEIDLGGVGCLIEHIGGDHSADSSVVYVPGEGVVFVGDCFYGAIYGTGPRFRFATIARLVDQLLGYGAESYLLGHTAAVIPRSNVEGWRDLLVHVARSHDASPEDLRSRLEDLVGVAASDVDAALVAALLEGRASAPSTRSLAGTTAKPPAFPENLHAS